MAPITRMTPQRVLEDLAAEFTLDDVQLLDITQQFLDDFRKGLGEYGHPMAMIPSFVTGVPDGTETGTFLALDLGGTNLRVCEVQLHGDKTFTLRQQKYKVSTSLKTGEASILFDYLADSVDAFLTDSGYEAPDDVFANAVPLGFTFSFPVEQSALASGKVLTWTKGFSARNAIGNDVVKLLQDAFDRKHLHVRCVALVNDTVGALLSRAYTAGGCVLGAIFGTGTNGAYLESVSNITKLADPASVPGTHMVINTEWGAFNNTRTVLPSTIFDNKLDRESINPGFQAFEKFISGMYLGEITRNALLALVDAAPRSLLFGGRASKALNEHYGVDTALMSAVEEAWEGAKDNGQEDIRKEAEEAEAQAEPAHSPAVDPTGSLTSKLKETHLGATPLTPSPHPESGVTTTVSAVANGTKPPSHLDVPPLFADGVKDTLDRVDDHTRSRLERVRKVLIAELSLPEDGVSLRDAAVVRYVASLVAKRAAALAACAVATVVVQQKAAQLGPKHNSNFKGERIAVGVDGSLIQFYPNFELHLREALRGLVGESVEKAVEIGMAKDGSGVGAALCALQAIKQLKH